MDLDLYLRVRAKEGRLYSDDIVAYLPLVPSGNPLQTEWLARSASASRLTRFLSRRPKPLIILDLGCGNGWLSNLLYKSGHLVIGMDQNHPELKQAARVFTSNPKLLFLEADIFSAPFAAGIFDVILLASVIQYFPDLPALLSILLGLLKPHGEIHIIDSPLYSNTELEDAIRRSQDYYTSIGFPEMSENYFHHCISELDIFHPKILYDPQQLIFRLKRGIGQTDSPFPWILLGKQVE